ncbi:MAG: LUD domain-containing protein [Actinomycetota bacterium]
MDEKLFRKVEHALAEPGRLESMRSAFRSVLDKQARNAGRIPDLEERRERLREVRASCAGDAALLERAVAGLEANRFRVLRAADAAGAVRLVLEEIGDEKLLVKSKTNLAREIGLSGALAEAGIEVVDTDIGDRVLQLAGEQAVHPTGPCAHLSRYDIAAILSEKLGIEVEADPSAIIEAVVADLVPHIASARVGLTGVNAICAAEGAVLMVHNEGNLDLVSQRPGKLIMLAGIEKVYPCIEDAVSMAKLETYYATGQPVTSFMRVIGGPSKTADIEKELYYGVHGPRELTLILVDNGRSTLMADEGLREALFCIGCGACLLECPVYDLVGPVYGSPGHLGGPGVCATPIPGSGRRMEAAVEAGLPLCTTCALCRERCPVRIDTPALVEELREMAVSAELLPFGEQATLVSSVRNYSNPWGQPRRGREKWAAGLRVPEAGESTTVFFAGCSLAYLAPEEARSAVRLLTAAGEAPLLLGADEACCGGPLARIGERDAFRETARRNIESLHAVGATRVVAACPGCLKALREYASISDLDIEVLHITQVLDGALAEGRLVFRAPEALTVTYHDPCHLGRGCGIFDEPRRLLEAVDGLTLLEMERSGIYSACCGAGGGVRTAFPALAARIAAGRVAMARETGADLLVTCCPWCEQNLGEAAGGAGGPEVVGLLGLLERCLQPRD